MVEILNNCVSLNSVFKDTQSIAWTRWKGEGWRECSTSTASTACTTNQSRRHQRASFSTLTSTLMAVWVRQTSWVILIERWMRWSPGALEPPAKQGLVNVHQPLRMHSMQERMVFLVSHQTKPLWVRGLDFSSFARIVRGHKGVSVRAPLRLSQWSQILDKP